MNTSLHENHETFLPQTLMVIGLGTAVTFLILFGWQIASLTVVTLLAVALLVTAQPILDRLPKSDEFGAASGALFGQISNLYSRTLSIEIEFA